MDEKQTANIVAMTLAWAAAQAEFPAIKGFFASDNVVEFDSAQGQRWQMTIREITAQG